MEGLTSDRLSQDIFDRLKIIKPPYGKKWTQPRHRLIWRRCDNSWCLIEIRKSERFCSEKCARSLMTIQELNQAIEFEARQDEVALNALLDSVTKRARDKWLNLLPTVLKVRWNVRDTNSQPHS